MGHCRPNAPRWWDVSFFFFSSRRRHTRCYRDWSSDVCSSDLPLLCFVGETGEWLHAKLRNGHAAASTGARRFLAECLRRVPEGVRLFLRADEGFYGKDFLAECERRRITYTIGAQLNRALRERIAAVADDDWRRASYRRGSEVTSFLWRPRTWKQARRL